MATSPLFGWEEPDDTDLVKDGAAAIRTLGNAIDTSMGDLLGGTTGQVLSKASNTDMDFTWVTSDDANAIQNTIVDAKGDLIAASAADTPARLAVGNNGETLVADSSTSTGLRYQATNAAGRNILQNGNFDIWQRGTTSAAIAYGTYLADRWKILNNGTGQNTTYSRDTSVPNAGSLYSAKVQQLTSAATGVSEYNLSQIFETSNIYQLCGKTITVSFWYRASTTGSHYVRIYSLQTGGTDVTTAFTVNAANTWEYKTINFSSFAGVTAIATADNANGGGIQVGPIVFGSGVNRTVAINEYFQITQVQIEAGSVATSFTRGSGTIQGELAACQRYYYQVGSAVGVNPGNGHYYSTTAAYVTTPFPVTMRVAPSATATNVGSWSVYSAGSGRAVSAFAFSTSSTISSTNSYTTSATTAGNGGWLESTSSNATLAFSSEL